MERSVELARMIQRKVCDNANRPDKGVHQAGFLVLRETSMPSCLIELGFITTPDEERILNNTDRVNDIAKSIYDGFAQYRNKYDKRVTVPYRPLQSGDVEELKEQESQHQVEPQRKNEAQKKVGTLKKTKALKRTEPQKKAEVQKRVVAQKKPEPKDAPVFKLQIFVSDRILRKGDAHFKGETDYESFREGNLVKYTMGASSNYNEVYRLRKSLQEKFPEAFIIAFKNGQKYDVNQAIREFKQNKNR